MAAKRQTHRNKVAVFIDVANECGCNMAWIMRAAQRQGRIEMAFGYGNFTNWKFLSPAAEALFVLGVRLIHCHSWGNGGYQRKDAADETMMLDIQHTLVTRPDISRYVICSGDGHFVPVVSQLRAAGKEVIVITPKDGASYLLIAAANRYLPAPDSGVRLPVDDSRPASSGGPSAARPAPARPEAAPERQAAA